MLHAQIAGGTRQRPFAVHGEEIVVREELGSR
jgi:hypothetical protein